MSSILFICTGNIFRSMVAEHALKAYLGEHSCYLVGSAGIEASLQTIHPFVRGLLLAKGVDVTAHVQRRLTQTLLDETALPVAMRMCAAWTSSSPSGPWMTTLPSPAIRAWPW